MDGCTLGRLLASRLGVPHISIRRLIDLEVDHRTALGLEIGAQPDAALLPMRLVAPLLDQLWTSGGPHQRFVLSGYPRDASQWRHLRRHTDVHRLVHVRAGSDFLRQSLKGRCACPACASGLYADELRLGDERVVPAVLECCGSTKEGVPSARDAPAAVAARLHAYETLTAPWLDSQRESGMVLDLWADARWPQVFPAIEQLLGLPPSVSADADAKPESAAA